GGHRHRAISVVEGALRRAVAPEETLDGNEELIEIEGLLEACIRAAGAGLLTRPRVRGHDHGRDVVVVSVPPDRTDEVGTQPVRQQEVHRSEEHTSELQSRENLVCRLLLEKKKR